MATQLPEDHRGLVMPSDLQARNRAADQIRKLCALIKSCNEMIDEARVIPLDGRPHVGTAIGSYMGDSRGRWEGEALVVETTNFKEKGGNGPSHLFTSAARMTERLTRIDPRTIRYEATVDDPKTWTRPWTAVIPLRQDPSYQLFEFACHEGNYWTMRSMLGGARLAEK